MKKNITILFIFLSVKIYAELHILSISTDKTFLKPNDSNIVVSMEVKNTGNYDIYIPDSSWVGLKFFKDTLDVSNDYIVVNFPDNPNYIPSKSNPAGNKRTFKFNVTVKSNAQLGQITTDGFIKGIENYVSNFSFEENTPGIKLSYWVKWQQSCEGDFCTTNNFYEIRSGDAKSGKNFLVMGFEKNTGLGISNTVAMGTYNSSEKVYIPVSTSKTYQAKISLKLNNPSAKINTYIRIDQYKAPNNNPKYNDTFILSTNTEWTSNTTEDIIPKSETNYINIWIGISTTGDNNNKVEVYYDDVLFFEKDKIISDNNAEIKHSFTVSSITNLVKIYGNVKDKDGKIISNVEVRIDEIGEKTTTDANGNYSFDDIQKGKYKIIFLKTGYNIVEKTLNANLENNKLDIIMVKIKTQKSSILLPHNVFYPSKGTLKIGYYIEKDSIAKIRILSLSGEIIKTYENISNTSGIVEWNGKNKYGNIVGAGVYLINLI